ncbi:MAG: protoporphyrinogen oxidase [Bdellovibrionota bacterium]
MEKSDIIIVGSGISGLLTAYFLSKRGLKLQILEAAPRSGGWIDGLSLRGQIFENGPNSILADEEWLKLLNDLNLSYIEKPKSLKKRFVWKNNRRQVIPLSVSAFLWSPLVSWGAKMSILGEIFRGDNLESADPSILEFFSARFHQDVADYLVDPFIGGIFAGDISKLSFKSVFPELFSGFKNKKSLIRAALSKKASAPKKIISFSGGIQSLVRALETKTPAQRQFDSRVENISFHDSSVQIMTNQNSYEARALVLATPAQEAARLLHPQIDEKSFRFLNEIFYQSVSLVHTLWRRPLNFEAGLGCLIPSKDKNFRGFRGSLWPSEIFPSRYDSQYLATTQYFSGEQPRVDLQEIQQIVGVSEEPLEIKRIDLGPSIPQFYRGHQEGVERLRGQLPDHVKCSGNYLDGVGLSAVFKTSLRLSDEILATL